MSVGAISFCTSALHNIVHTHLIYLRYILCAQEGNNDNIIKKVSQYQYIILGRLCLLRRGCDGIFLLTVPPNRRGYSPSMGDGGGDGGVDLRFVMMWRGGDGVLARHPLQSSSCMRGFVFDWRRRQTMRGQRQSRSPLRLRCGGRRVSGASKIVVFDYSI